MLPYLLFVCYYCHFQTRNFNEIIDHNITRHPNEYLRYKEQEINDKTQTTRTQNFKIIPNEIKRQGKFIIPNHVSKKISVQSLQSDDLTNGPSSPKRVCRNPLQSDDASITCDCINDSLHDNQQCTTEFSDTVDCDHDIEDIISILPLVFSNLRAANQLDTFLKFISLVSTGSFPLDNIAWRLFGDVVQWYSIENSSFMRYSDIVKRFWRTGLKLFKGKFLRFMSGLKNNGNIYNGYSERGQCRPQQSEINFVVPSRNILDSLKHQTSEEVLKPGILPTMIEAIGDQDLVKVNSFKLCVDGKRINSSLSSKCGDIDLWGNEEHPTLAANQSRFNDEISQIQKASDFVNNIDQDQNKQFIPTKFREAIRVHCLNIIQLISNRIKELRILKVRKQLAHDKFRKQVSGDWRNSKFAYAISSVKTSMFEIASCIHDSLACVDNLGRVVADVNDVKHLYLDGSFAYLDHQENYVCLQNHSISSDTNVKKSMDVVDTSKVKQRTHEWTEIRDKAHVTGSTCFSAIGLDTLKQQQAHFRRIFEKDTETTVLSKDVQDKMEYGTKNEINCIATLVGKILPIFYENLLYVEEGCYKMNVGTSSVVVSPDGSLRDESNRPILGIEIKCPFPGKVFTTPVNYSIPLRYVPQIMCEMASLKTDKLLFLSFSHESTSVLEATFDDTLWEMICEILRDTYGENQKLPTKLHPRVNSLRQRMKDYIQSGVRFVAEVPSLQAVKCTHEKNYQIADGHMFHHRSDGLSKRLKLDDVLDTLKKSKTVIETAYQLQRQKASEVLVFLLSDMDRIAKKEIQHSIPVAYALKGYSMKTDVMRKMLDSVLLECKKKGLYVPVISFDGQWYNICVRSKEEKTLTVLQLQKDVFKKSKNETKFAILNRIFYLNTFDPCSNLSELSVVMNIDRVQDNVGKIKGPIIVGSLRNKDRPIVLSSHLSMILQGLKNVDHQNNRTDGICTSPNGENGNDIIAYDSNTVEETGELLIDYTLPIYEILDCETDEKDSCELQTSVVPIPENRSKQRDGENFSAGDANGDYDNGGETYLDNFFSNETHTPTSFFQFKAEDYCSMFVALQNDPKTKTPKLTDVMSFEQKFASVDVLSKFFDKHDAHICLKTMASKMKNNKIQILLSWPKYKMIKILCQSAAGFQVPCNDKEINQKRRTPRDVPSLSKLCKQTIRKFPKDILNIIYSEYIFPEELENWRKDMPFEDFTDVRGVDSEVRWYSKPEYSNQNHSYQFYLLDCHHLLTNMRIKCCKTGMVEAGISRNAWAKLTMRSGNTSPLLSAALVEDLTDKQSNAFARQTFSESVESAMLSNGDVNEAHFCRLIREWYSAEDDPGISANERCKRRMALREWLLKDIHFNAFPPPGSFVKGMPIVSFEGMMINIERRLQLFPFIKKGSYNVMSLGSLEAENFFGEFQDLDPRGSGVIKPEDISSALSTACELLHYRLDTDRGFYMHTSKTKVYPQHGLHDEMNEVDMTEFANELPSRVSFILPKDHVFDMPERRTHKQQRERKRVHISNPTMSARGAKPVREYHRINESKILAHVRKGLNIEDINM